MLDLEARTPELEAMAQKAASDKRALAVLLEGLMNMKCPVRYKNFKVAFVISEERPEALYEKWEFFKKLLKSGNNTFVFYAIHILANLSKVDVEGKFDGLFNHFFGILQGDALVPACHVAYVAHKVARAKPGQAGRVTERLLNLDGATYKHKELVQANAMISFSKYFDEISQGDKERIVKMAHELQGSKSSKVRKEATEFFKITGVPCSQE
ncbi:MAG: hypothetical protein LUP94_01685 [Candidatus Methanomethylicus sp.]|nr:hypothetical protein [Candidatus Methanomethylicus sp.]